MNSRDDGTGEVVDVAMKMFKELIRYTTLDTRSTDAILRTRIRHLPDYSATVKGDIPMERLQFCTKCPLCTSVVLNLSD